MSEEDVWVVRIERDDDDKGVECVFIVNTKTGQRVRQEGLGRYLADVQKSERPGLIKTYMTEAQHLAEVWNEDPAEGEREAAKAISLHKRLFGKKN
jgi:hypothetical protein